MDRDRDTNRVTNINRYYNIWTSIWKWDSDSKIFDESNYEIK